MKNGRWRNVLCIQNSILIQYIMDEKENIFVSNEIIRLWYKDWSGTVKFIHSSYLLLLLYTIPIYIVHITRITKLSGLLIFQVFDYIFVII